MVAIRPNTCLSYMTTFNLDPSFYVVLAIILLIANIANNIIMH